MPVTTSILCQYFPRLHKKKVYDEINACFFPYKLLCVYMRKKLFSWIYFTDYVLNINKDHNQDISKLFSWSKIL